VTQFKRYLINDSDDEERKILESGASIKRVMSKLKDITVDFGMITSFRKYDDKNNKVSLKVNQANNNKLLRTLRSKLGDNKGYGAYRLIGHWKECSIDLPDGTNISKCVSFGGKVESVLEESWLILNQPKSDNFFNVLQSMAKQFNQDAFISRVNGDFGLFGKDGNKWESYGNLTDKSISKGFKDIIGLQGYSELKKKRSHGDIQNIIFSSISENIEFDGISVPNDHNASYMLYKYMNLLWK